MQDVAFKNTKFFIFPTITHPPTVRFVTPTVMAMLLIAVKFKKIHSTYIHPILTLAFFHIFLFPNIPDDDSYCPLEQENTEE